MQKKSIKSIGQILTVSAALFSFAGTAQAGSIVLTGHDTLLHGGQSDYDDLILDYLRGVGTASTIDRGDYDIAFLTNGGVPNPTTRWQAAGWGNVMTASPTSFADGAAFTSFLSGKDALVIPWRIDIGAAGSAAINSFAAEITTFFNAGGDIWANSSRAVGLPGSLVDPDFYNFLPPGAAASGDPLPGDPSSGFVATAAGLALGITPAMINGDPTHNVFSIFDSDFVVLETFGENGPVITLGIQDATIDGGGVGTGGDPCTETGGACEVPEPGGLGSLALFGLGLIGMGLARRKLKA